MSFCKTLKSFVDFDNIIIYNYRRSAFATEYSSTIKNIMDTWWITIACSSLLIFVVAADVAAVKNDANLNTTEVSQPSVTTTPSISIQQVTSNGTTGTASTTTTILPTDGNVASQAPNTTDRPLPKIPINDHFELNWPSFNSTDKNHTDFLASTLHQLTKGRSTKDVSSNPGIVQGPPTNITGVFNSTVLPNATFASTSTVGPLVQTANVSNLSHGPLGKPADVKAGQTASLVQDPMESALYSTKVALGFFITFTIALLVGSVFMYRRMRRYHADNERTVFTNTSYGDLRNDNYNLSL